MKKLLLLPIALILFGCPQDDMVDVGNRTKGLIGEYHLEDITREEPDGIRAERIYHVKITSATKKDQVNVETKEVYLYRRVVKDPLVAHAAPDIRYFEDVNVVDTKKFLVEEIRDTDWGDSRNATTNIRIEGKLTGDELNVSFQFYYPEHDKHRSHTWKLKKL